MPARAIAISVDDTERGWIARVVVGGQTLTTHTVRITRDELQRYGGGDVTNLVRRSFEFLLDRESNTTILRDFDLGVIERYFPEYTAAMTRR